jgi:hypothetical protein
MRTSFILLIFGYLSGNPLILTPQSFKGRPPASSPYFAETSCNVLFATTDMMLLPRNKIKFKQVVTKVVVNSKSWIRLDSIKTQKQLADLLQHEQGHVDLFIVQSHYLRSALKKKIFDKSKMQMQSDSIAVSLAAQFDSIQKEYDEGTKHMLDTAKQKLWNSKIKLLLFKSQKL